MRMTLISVILFLVMIAQIAQRIPHLPSMAFLQVMKGINTESDTFELPFTEVELQAYSFVYY